MIVRSLQLKHIRSYDDVTITFPEGSILLSGDIGSGKTTILLAIEFALFGIVRGAVSGNALLRHGKHEGSVELHCEIDGKEVIIHRTLKGGKGIKQEAGFVIVNGERLDGTAIELKSKILELIGYPDELLTKSKSLIYRYTVYTPQEEMKHILLESSEERLQTIRRLFNIDKYRRVKENTAFLIKEIKQERDVVAGRTTDMPKLVEEKEKKTILVAEKKKIDERLRENLAKARQSLMEKHDDQEKNEAKIRELESFARELAVVETKKKGLTDQKTRLNDDIRELQASIGEEPPEGKDSSVLEKEIRGIEEIIHSLLEKESSLNQRIGEWNGKKKHAEDLIVQVGKLTHCPTCLQDVTGEHKDEITKKEQEKIEGLLVHLRQFSLEKEGLQKEILEERKRLKSKEGEEKEVRLSQLKRKNYEEKLRRVRFLEEQVKKTDEVAVAIEKRRLDLRSRIEASKNIEEELKKAKASLEDARSRFHALEIDESRVKTEIRNLEETLDGLAEELLRLAGLKEREKRLSDVLQWLSTQFFDLVDAIERQILLKVYNEFNSYFQEWFSIIMEDESLKVRLGEDFSPLIEQDGYETAYDMLSGGEKTAVALAYRLSLFRIINDFMNEIKTKGLIILDEPTDGFSSEQLDRVRDVLEQLKARQIIIVSHEQKMESFVENVIRVVKENHVSRIG
jgi:exonuclease SbcC